MIEGKTKAGFVYKLEDDIADDMELLEGFIDLDNGEWRGIKTTIAKLLGEEQKNALYDFYRGENGRVKASVIMEAVGEILAAAQGNLKN